MPSLISRLFAPLRRRAFEGAGGGRRWDGAGQIDNLNASVFQGSAKGHKSYHFVDRGMEYADPDQLKAALAEIEQRIAALSGTGSLREVRISSTKGLS